MWPESSEICNVQLSTINVQLRAQQARDPNEAENLGYHFDRLQESRKY